MGPEWVEQSVYTGIVFFPEFVPPEFLDISAHFRSFVVWEADVLIAAGGRGMKFKQELV